MPCQRYAPPPGEVGGVKSVSATNLVKLPYSHYAATSYGRRPQKIIVDPDWREL